MVAGMLKGDSSWRRVLDSAPAAVVALLLLLATWFQGAFALKHWAPVAILALVMLAAGAAAGGLRFPARLAAVAAAALWLLAAWALLSGLWSESPGRALEGAGRTALYAALFTTGCLVSDRRAANWVGALVVGGLVAIAGVTLLRLLFEGESLFLAGRLDDPVGYRNATACLFALPFWPLAAAAARHSLPAPLRSVAFAGAYLVLGLVFLTQARGVVLGLALGGVVALSLGPDRLRRAWVALAVVAGVALSSGSLLAPFRAFSDRKLTASAPDIETAAAALAAGVGVALALGLAAALLDGGLRLTPSSRRRLRLLAGVGLASAAVAGVVAAVALSGDPIGFAQDRAREFRSLEAAAPGETRLTFGGGQRFDLWRVALNEFEAHPVGGGGEGSYPFAYYLDRATDRNLSTPHSLAFELLAELGAVGLLCLLAFAAAVAVAGWRVSRGDPAEGWWPVALLAAGAVVLGQTVVDWLWLVPGVVGLGVLLLGLGIAGVRSQPGLQAPSRLIRGLVALALALGTVGVTILLAGDVFVRQARAESAPAKRLSAARTAETFDPWLLSARYLQAGALEELGQVGAARAALLDALDLEPNNFVTLGLLGDLEVRQGDEEAAKSYYRRALLLNPRDVGLRELAQRGSG